MTPHGEVVACGDELVHGARFDTNSREIAWELEAAGVPVHRYTVVGDDPERLQQCLQEACSRAAVVVVTGGLGPTLDDRTRDAVAALVGADLRFDEPSWQRIQDWLRARRRPVPESNRRQAMLPAPAQALDNPVGTAPGFRVRVGACDLFALPGVPREMRAMLRDHVLPFVRSLPDGRPTASHALRVVGPSEALLGERLERWMAPGRDPAVGITAHHGLLTVRVVASSHSLEDARAQCLRTADELRPALAAWLVDEGDEELQFAAGRALLARGIKTAVAESCTGGLLVARLTDVPGISAVLLGGFVTYADAAKMAQLAVPAELLARHGAVSEPVAAAMAAGAAQALGADLGIGITGIAGPGGGTAAKPVGTVCFGLWRAGAGRSWTLRIPDLGREFVRERAVLEALVALLRAANSA